MKYAIVLIILGIIFIPLFQNRDRLHQQFEAFTQGVTLPFRLATLSSADPDAFLLMPVEGIRVKDVADTWHGARSEGRLHEGQDIFAKRGTPVYSATNGYLLHEGEDKIGGNIIYVLGSGGRRYYYAHLESFNTELSRFDQVSTTTIVGYVGTTGNASGTPPHLHFGVYGKGGALNPLPLLIDR
jgi:murein DD-endopeptidase MepM/ murein hydrolase activator NlpD